MLKCATWQLALCCFHCLNVDKGPGCSPPALLPRREGGTAKAASPPALPDDMAVLRGVPGRLSPLLLARAWSAASST